MKWIEDEVRILKESYILKGEYNLSNTLNRSPNAIRIKASRLTIKKLAEREKIILSSVEEQVILGGLLGDLYCVITATGKNAKLEGAHCKEQAEYLFWKLSLLRSLSFHIRKNKFNAVCFESRSYPCLNYYRDLFYGGGKKAINLNILNNLNKLGIAIWYMDDGSYNKRDKNCCLHTNGFTYQENLLIKRWFENKWNISPKIYMRRSFKNNYKKVWYYLSFNVNETKKFIALIGDHIHPSMGYKTGVK